MSKNEAESKKSESVEKEGSGKLAEPEQQKPAIVKLAIRSKEGMIYKFDKCHFTPPMQGLLFITVWDLTAGKNMSYFMLDALEKIDVTYLEAN